MESCKAGALSLISMHGFNKISSDIRIYSVILAWWSGRRGRPEMTLLWVYMIRLTPSPITQHFLADATPLEKLSMLFLDSA